MNSSMMRSFVSKDRTRSCKHLMCYRGIRCSQSPNVLDSLDRLYEATVDDPTMVVVEIGTFNGGLTRILFDHDVCGSAKIHTFDTSSIPASSGQMVGVDFHVGDVFDDRLQRVIDIVSTPTRVFLFCDGGDKKREVNTFCRHMKSGDVVLCHDYVGSPSDLIDWWPSYEVRYDDVKFELVSNGFVPFVDMQQSMWGCFIKE